MFFIVLKEIIYYNKRNYLFYLKDFFHCIKRYCIFVPKDIVF